MQNNDNQSTYSKNEAFYIKDANSNNKNRFYIDDNNKSHYTNNSQLAMLNIGENNELKKSHETLTLEELKLKYIALNIHLFLHPCNNGTQKALNSQQIAATDGIKQIWGVIGQGLENATTIQAIQNILEKKLAPAPDTIFKKFTNVFNKRTTETEDFYKTILFLTKITTIPELEWSEYLHLALTTRNETNPGIAGKDSISWHNLNDYNKYMPAIKPSNQNAIQKQTEPGHIFASKNISISNKVSFNQ